jgi:hypothetical protein
MVVFTGTVAHGITQCNTLGKVTNGENMVVFTGIVSQWLTQCNTNEKVKNPPFFHLYFSNVLQLYTFATFSSALHGVSHCATVPVNATVFSAVPSNICKLAHMPLFQGYHTV